jgi:hypothetical protein
MTLIPALLAAATVITVHIDSAPGHQVNSVSPLRAIGTSVDSESPGDIQTLWAPDRVAQEVQAGFGTLSLRLYTELSVQDWHWNPAGTFSAGTEGYWTSSAVPTSTELVDSYGYQLPHRGDTQDQGDNNGYSRIDDGDPYTYWKSDPYLTTRFTGEPDYKHPQWAVIDLDAVHEVDGIQIGWSNPFATHFRVQYWLGGNARVMPNGTYLQPPGVVTGFDTVDAIIDQSHGSWHDFPDGVVTDGAGGNDLLRLGRAPIQTHWVRILMTASSNTCDTHGSLDVRNCVGYAIQDVSVGLIDSTGELHDLVRHALCGGDPTRPGCYPHQSMIYTSSDDPWHTADDRIKTDQDQPGLDIVSRSALTRGLPVMYPVPLFYSTPQNAANEVAYLEARHYKIGYIEMGEEVDGQYAEPEDYAALYIQFAEAIHTFYPRVKLGGPVFEGVNIDTPIWADGTGDMRWFHRFLLYLKSHGHLGDLAFMSFEHYPFVGSDQDGRVYEDLIQEPAIVKNIVDMWHADGLSPSVPMFMTEDNFANNGGPVPKQLAGGLWMADWIASSLTDGVKGVNYYQIEAEPTGHEDRCACYGGYGVFLVDNKWRIIARTSQFWTARMLTSEWFAAGDTPQGVYAATTDLGSNDVTAYSVKRPDGSWSVMLVNKESVARQVRVEFSGAGRFSGPVVESTFGSAQYFWSGEKLEPPDPDTGIVTSTQPGPVYTIPAESVTVLRGPVH